MLKIYDKEVKLGLALSGGGSRAIAFHLGCMKALNNLGLLNNVDVISSVSGGSIINAFYSYSSGSFDDFEHKMKTLLSKGLQTGIFLMYFSPLGLLVIANSLIVYITVILNLLISLPVNILTKLFHIDLSSTMKRLFIKIPRKYNRTVLFEKYLNNEYFHGLSVKSPRRNNLSVVINACELKTGTAFRFGNKESGCWRYGKLLDNNVNLSTAVTASAAYPIFLPAIERKWNLINREGKEIQERLYLIDGGVYENLGLSSLEPDKSSKYSYNAYPCKFIICCNAGQGQFSKDSYPIWWGARMVRAFESVFRKLQDSYADKLHIYKRTKEIDGFVFPYLGQQDLSLPFEIDNLVKREEVIDYPTDFAAMPIDDMNRLILRGEQLTEALLKYYYPSLIN